MKLKLTAIILTYNEQINLPECINSIKEYTDEILVIDSFSTDRTIEIAKSFGCKTYQNKFINQAKQFIWAIENTDIKNEWILRIDADERWAKEGFDELKKIIEADSSDGVYVKMKIFFMGRWIKHGGFYPNYFLRVYKKSKGKIEDRWMDEHIKVEGKTIISNIDVIESNYDRQKNISLWTDKHNKYSTREAIEFLIAKHNLKEMDTVANFWGNKTERKRWLKEKLYFHIPLFLRPFLYYIHRYIFKFGFLDGKEGFIFHYLHAFWYRFLVDVKVYQIEQLAKKENKTIPEVIKEHYGIEF
ncbi:glycosyltransferase family 2 protein [Ignavibacterium sp.]|uniref:glycosyltransferase family 2 protein n=1 Tax=Ignavibacterium sp. TaxID=2651167 RepID=UPI00307E4685